jgi:putative membrane protein
MGEAAPPQLKAGIEKLGEQYGAFNKGISSYTSGVKKTAESYSAVNNGINELVKGTAELYSNTKGLDKQVQDKIDISLSDLKGGEFTPTSFVSDKNTNVTMVQFVMKTDGVQIPSEVVDVVEQPKKLSFWEKLRALFGL